MKHDSEGDKGWDPASPDAHWSGSPGALDGASGDGAPPSSLLAHLLAISCEEFAWLQGILREPRYGAAIRGIDGAVLPVIAAGAPNEGDLNEQSTLSAPIYDPEGKPLVFLDLTPRDVEHSSVSRNLLRAIVASAARAIAERWFRICYRRRWIVAARGANDPDRRMLLAIDRDYRVVGADHDCRQNLHARGMALKSGVGLTAFFRFYPTDLRGAQGFESSRRLSATDDGSPWWVLITSPDLSADKLLHSRPRMETIASLSNDSTQKLRSFGLPLHMRRRIEELIEARLESGVDLAELATSVGFSLSHFFRMFRRSYGVPPTRYLMHRKLSVARDLLMKTDLRLATIALKTGFADQSHFSRNFQRVMGLPPGAFRIQHRLN